MTDDPEHIRIGEILRRNLEAEERAEAQRIALGPHPVALALRDIAVGLEALGRWRDFIHPPTGRMFLHALSSGPQRRDVFSRVEVRSWRPGLHTEEDRLVEIVSRLLELKGMTRLEAPIEPQVQVHNIAADDLSAHERFAIIGAVRADLVRVEASL